MLEEDRSHIKEEWVQLDKKDYDKLREFFCKYSFLTIYDLAQTIDLTPYYIRKHRRNAGFVSKVKLPQPKIKQVPAVIDVPPHWDTKEWFESVYPKYGMYTICKMTGQNPSKIYRRMKKYGIKIRSHKEAMHPKNEYCNKQWLEDCYIHQKMSLPEMAKIAGVSIDSITTWLNRYKISIRISNYAALLDENNGVQAKKEQGHNQRDKTE